MSEVLSQADWDKAVEEAKSMLRQAEMVRVQGELLLKYAEDKLKEISKKKDK